VTFVALLTGEDHQRLATASTLRWGLLSVSHHGFWLQPADRTACSEP
jgi:hypothetical protein